jgi:hypothetical protein
MLKLMRLAGISMPITPILYRMERQLKEAEDIFLVPENWEIDLLSSIARAFLKYIRAIRRKNVF